MAVLRSQFLAFLVVLPVVFLLSDGLQKRFSAVSGFMPSYKRFSAVSGFMPPYKKRFSAAASFLGPASTKRFSAVSGMFPSKRFQASDILYSSPYRERRNALLDRVSNKLSSAVEVPRFGKRMSSLGDPLIWEYLAEAPFDQKRQLGTFLDSLEANMQDMQRPSQKRPSLSSLRDALSNKLTQPRFG